MGYQQLVTLARSYPAGDRDYLLKRAHEYRVRDESTLLDLAASGLNPKLTRKSQKPSVSSTRMSVSTP